MARSQYGPVVVAMPGTGGALNIETQPLVASRTQGGAAETDLQTVGGSPITAPDPDDTTGAATWLGPDGYTGSMWVKDPSTNIWWEVPPANLANRVGGVSSVAIYGATAVTGAVSIPLPTWTQIRPTLGVPESDLDSAAQAKIDNAISKAIVDIKGDLIVGSAADTVVRKAPGTNGQYLTADSASATGLTWVTPPDITNKADKSGSIRQFADVSDLAPADGSIPMWDAASNSLLWVDPTSRFAAADPSTGRLAQSAYPKYYRDLVIINQGENTPTDAYQPIVYSRPGGANMTPTMLVQNSAQGSNNVVLTLPEQLAVGDSFGIAVGISGETSTIPLGSVLQAFSAGAATVTWTALNFPNPTVATGIAVGRVTTVMPSGTTITLTAKDTGGANLSRVHLLAGAFRVPNIAATSPLDLQVPAGGNSSGTMTTIATGAPATDTVQSSEIAIGTAAWNSGAGTVSRTLDGTNGWAELMERESDNGASARSLWVGYKTLTATGRPTLTTLMTSNEATPATGQWAALLATLKGA